MFDLGSIFKEIHRRSLWQVLGAYLAVAWITLQVIEVLMGTIGLPDWVPLFAIVILLIGLPVVLATAFIQRGIGRWRTGSDVGARGDASNEMGQPESDTRETSPLAEEPAHAGEQSAEPSPLRHHLFTWRNALIAGVVAFAMLGAGTGGYMLMRSLGIGPAGTLVAKGLLAERAPAVLADFTSTTGDSLLARVATEALRVDLSQSEAVRLVESSKVGEALARMQRSTDEALTLDLARELAIREGIPAAIGGEISSAGHGFVLSARLVATADGNALASHRVSAADSSEIISAIDELSKKLRERIGESLKSLQHDDPLERVTTKSLPALRRYSLAVRAIETEGDAERGIELLEEAVALDTTFAMAYRKLGVALSNRGIRRERQVAVIRKAYENRDRLTTRERYLTAGSYFMSVANDLQRAAAAYETLLELDPTEDRALNNLGVVYTQLGEHAEAERYYRRAIEADSTDLLPYGNVAIAQIAQGKFGEARATLDEAKRRSPGYLAP